MRLADAVCSGPEAPGPTFSGLPILPHEEDLASSPVTHQAISPLTDAPVMSNPYWRSGSPPPDQPKVRPSETHIVSAE
jgi:hypothetical protein